MEGWNKICVNDNKDKDYAGIMMGQFIDGVDAFYRDYRHRNLEIASRCNMYVTRCEAKAKRN